MTFCSRLRKRKTLLFEVSRGLLISKADYLSSLSFFHLLKVKTSVKFLDQPVWLSHLVQDLPLFKYAAWLICSHSEQVFIECWGRQSLRWPWENPTFQHLTPCVLPSPEGGLELWIYLSWAEYVQRKWWDTVSKIGHQRPTSFSGARARAFSLSPPRPPPIMHSPGIQLPCWAAPHGGRPRLLITNRGSEHGPASPPATPLSHQMKPQSQPRVRLYKLVSSLNPVASG